MAKNGLQMRAFGVVLAGMVWILAEAHNGLRYDESTVLFSPSGSLMQVEYAVKVEACIWIWKCGACLRLLLTVCFAGDVLRPWSGED
jgi:hypothetical protein